MSGAAIWPEAACLALYEATRRGDARAVQTSVAKLGVLGPLQLLGDGLLLCVRRGVARAEAAQVVALLEARDWDGDRVLAGTLAAALGHGEAPPGAEVPVDLAVLAALMDEDPRRGEVAVDRVSGAVRLASWEAEEALLLSDAVASLTPGSLGGAGDTARFAAALPAGPGREALEAALSGPDGSLARFYYVLRASPSLEAAFSAYRRERALGRARSWLASEGLLVGVVPAG